MFSTDPMFIGTSTEFRKGSEAVEMAPQFALLVGARLKAVTGVPLSRFDVIAPVKEGAFERTSTVVDRPRPALRCRVDLLRQVGQGFNIADAYAFYRYVAPDNATFSCTGLTYSFGAEGVEGQSTTWDIVIEGPTDVDGDKVVASTIAHALVDASARHMRLFSMNFPGTKSVLRKEGMPKTGEHALTLGANPGGLLSGPIPKTGDVGATTAPEASAHRNDQELAMHMVRDAEAINEETSSEVKDLFLRMSRASEAHLTSMTYNPFQPPVPGASGPLLYPHEKGLPEYYNGVMYSPANPMGL